MWAFCVPINNLNLCSGAQVTHLEIVWSFVRAGLEQYSPGPKFIPLPRQIFSELSISSQIDEPKCTQSEKLGQRSVPGSDHLGLELKSLNAKSLPRDAEHHE